MSLPAEVRVKLSSEAAGAVSLTPVVVRDMPVAELVETVLCVYGKHASRIREVLARGTLIEGATRFRWTGWDAETAALDALLATFPDADPGRALAPQACRKIVLRAEAHRLELARDAASRTKLFRRRSFWHWVLELAGGAAPAYVDYCYREKADRYRIRLDHALQDRLRDAAGDLVYPTLTARIRSTRWAELDLLVPR